MWSWILDSSLAALGITMALSGHIREMKMVGLLVPVDSRFRGNDGVGLPSIFIAMTGALG